MDPTTPFLHCSHCGERIGVYEALWIELADGALRPSSFLNLAGDARPAGAYTRLWHLGCLAPDQLPRAAEA